MKDLAKIFAVIIVVAIWWVIIWSITSAIYSDPKYLNSYKPLIVSLPLLLIPFGLWVKYYFKKNKGA
jgi:hypothetical protein